jgi:hypothetical protein
MSPVLTMCNHINLGIAGNHGFDNYSNSIEFAATSNCCNHSLLAVIPYSNSNYTVIDCTTAIANTTIILYIMMFHPCF